MSVARAEADLARLQAEMTRLRGQLAEMDERATKVRHYIELARIYDAGDDAQPAAPRQRQGGNAAVIVQATCEALRENDGPMHTRALLDALQRRGVGVAGANPVNYLSGVLSRSDDFENDRMTGWHLRSWKTATNPVKASEVEPMLPEDGHEDADDHEPTGFSAVRIHQAGE